MAFKNGTLEMENADCFLTIEKLTTGKIEGHELWDSITLPKSTLLIGRPSPNMLVPNITIRGDNSISRGDHIRIDYDPQKYCYTITDPHRKYGTSLDGEPLEKNKPYPLKDNMRIGLAGD